MIKLVKIKRLRKLIVSQNDWNQTPDDQKIGQKCHEKNPLAIFAKGQCISLIDCVELKAIKYEKIRNALFTFRLLLIANLGWVTVH